MNLYVIKRKLGVCRDANIAGASRVLSLGKGAIYIEAVHAFFKKKDAIAYIKDSKMEEFWEVIKAEVCPKPPKNQ